MVYAMGLILHCMMVFRPEMYFVVFCSMYCKLTFVPFLSPLPSFMWPDHYLNFGAGVLINKSCVEKQWYDYARLLHEIISTEGAKPVTVNHLMSGASEPGAY